MLKDLANSIVCIGVMSLFCYRFTSAKENIILPAPPIYMVDSTITSTVTDTLHVLYQKFLDEIEIKANRNLYRILPDRIIYDSENDTRLIGKNALDALKNSPFIYVNGNGDIQSSNYESISIKINGLNNPIFSSENIVDALISLPAKFIKKIEVVTGQTDTKNSVITLNIVTKGNIEGYRGTVSTKLEDDIWMNKIWGMTKIKKYCMALSYNNSWIYEHPYSSTLQEKRYNSTALYEISKYINNRGYKSDNNNIEGTLSYEFDRLTMLTTYGRIIMKCNPHNTSYESAYSKNQAGDITGIYSKSNSTTLEDSEYEASIMFERLFSEDAERGKFSLGYEFYGRPIRSSINEIYDEDSFLSKDQELSSSMHNFCQLERSHEYWHTIEGEYRNIFMKKHMGGVSAKVRFRNDREYKKQENSYFIASFQPSEYDSTSFGISQFNEQITLNYQYKIPKFLFNASISEIYYYNQIQGTLLQKSFTHKEFLFNGTGSATYVATSKHSYTINYNNYSSIPNIYAMSPYIDTNQAGQIRYGNPHLKPERTNNINFLTRINHHNTQLQFALQYANSKNIMLERRFLKDETLHITTENIARHNHLLLSGNLKEIIKDRTTVVINSHLLYSIYKASFSGEGRHGVQFILKCNLEQKLFRNCYLECATTFNTPTIYLQGKGGKDFRYNIGLSQSLLQSKLHLSLSAYSFIPLYYKKMSISDSPGYYSQLETRSFHASFSFTLRYTFGRLRANPHEVNSQITNNDIKYDYERQMEY